MLQSCTPSPRALQVPAREALYHPIKCDAAGAGAPGAKRKAAIDEWTWKDVATRVSSGGDDDRGITRKKDAVDDDARFRRDDDDGVGARMFRRNLARMRRRGRCS